MTDSSVHILPDPVWFRWQQDPGSDWGDGSFLIFNDNSAARLRTFTERPRVEAMGIGKSLGEFMAKYSVVTRIRPVKVRGV